MQKQQLSQKMLQKLSPQQIQLMKLLQVPTVMLDQRIQEELELNPALELEENINDNEEDKDSQDNYDDDDLVIGSDKKETQEEDNDFADDDFDNIESDDFSTELEEFPIEANYDDYEDYDNSGKDGEYLDEYLNDYLGDDTAAYKLDVNNYSADQEEKTIPIAVESSFGEYLESQLGMLELNETDQRIAMQLIGNIDDDGYLRRETSALVDDLMFTDNTRVDEQRVIAVLENVIQKFDPPGVGARNLQECLELQLLRKLQAQETLRHYNAEEMKHLKLAYTIIKDYFDEFSKKHYPKLMRQLSLFNEDLKLATDEIILKLNPKPGSAFASSKNRSYIIPDFIIENKNGVLELSLNARNAPELRVNQHYKEMLEAYSANKKDRKQKEAALFVKQKIDAARWFIDAIKQRQDTMFRTMYTILTYQEEYFLSGDEKKFKPMILKDIAEITGLDISTVSRVASEKYVQTEFGTKKLKEFFSESLQNDSGEEVSTLEVKKILTEIIESENKRKPHSDEKLKSILTNKGYNIARRTVAKYREQLGIPVARLRKGI